MGGVESKKEVEEEGRRKKEEGEKEKSTPVTFKMTRKLLRMRAGNRKKRKPGKMWKRRKR